MAIASYTELKDTVERYLARTDRDSEIPDWIRLVEAEVARKLKLRSQQKTVSSTLTGGSNTVLTPAGILYPELLVFDSQPPQAVEIVSLPVGEAVDYWESGEATPGKASIWGVDASYQTQIRVWPTPPNDVDYTLYYRDDITPLTAAAPVNYLLLVAPDVYLYGCLSHGYLFDQDVDSAAIWRQPFNGAIREVKRIEAMARAKGGLLRMRPSSGMTP